MSQSEAQRRAEARRAKILARGNAGLAKLASTARGEEASVLYDNTTPSRTPTPSARPAQPAEDPSAAYQVNLERTMAALGASSSDRRQDAGTVDPMQAFQEMMNKMGTGQNIPSMENASVDPTEDPPTPELEPTRLPAINDSPFGFPPSTGGGDMSSMFSPEMMQMLQNAGGAPGSSPFAAAPPAATEKTLLARLMPLIHVLTISVCFALTILIWEPSVWASGAGAGRAVVQTIGGRDKRWSGLRGDSGGLASDVLTSGWASLPVFWAFVSLEILLYSIETMLTPPSPPRLPAPVAQFLPLVPQRYSRPLLRVLKIAGMASRVVGDACLLVFLFGMAVIIKGRA
ncbi:hypothetical protein NCC49_005745 [Naganishia albida]|nr:hypothetical protein NCC49_005745 [Naganishia albida]